MLDLLIKGGEVVSSATALRADVGVKDGKIVLVASPGSIDQEAGRTIDAAGKYVLPGGVDAHVHFNLPLSAVMTAQSADPGTMAAAFGGTTTFIDFAKQNGEGSLLGAIEDKRQEIAADRPHVDYALHAMITGRSTSVMMDEMPDAYAEGITSFKMFTAFSADDDPVTGGSLYSDDGRIWGVMTRAAKLGAVVMVHCEDDSLINYNIHCLYREGKQQASNIHLARTGLTEEAAISRMLLLSRRSGAPLYVCHITSSGGVEAVAEAQGRREPVFGEALHHNLSFTSDMYAREDGPLYHTYPGLKSHGDQKALWSALREGIVHSVSSDDFTLPKSDKLAGRNVDNVTGGHNGIETRMGVFYSEGVQGRRVSINQFVDLTSEAPAKIFGLFPQKGAILPGSDADIVLFDPNLSHEIRQTELHADCDYSVWDGWKCHGYPVTTILRGQVLVQDRKWVGPKGTGRFIASGSPMEP
jgi:dihydropyrimidinase